MSKYKFLAIFLILLGVFLGYFLYISQTDEASPLYRPFKLGLDLSGGTHLVYDADTSEIESTSVSESMSALREVIERRVNLFGVSEPIVQVEQSGIGENASHRLIVELPGVTDIAEALKLIDRTPVLEFRLEPEGGVDQEALGSLVAVPTTGTTTGATLSVNLQDLYNSTGLTGRYVERAQVIFSNQGGVSAPEVLVKFNTEGESLLTKVTGENIGKSLAIFLDGELLSAPVIQSKITGGEAVITGSFSIDEANLLVRDLNLGALPVPIELVSTQTVGATLGEVVLSKGVEAGIIGLLAVSLFMVFWYRLPGLLAVLALTFYVILMLVLFKLVSVTLTAAGIAGFILSIGIAVDANVLIFERMKEELRDGKRVVDSINEGFSRAWLSIRDSNISSILSATVLFWFGSSLIQGFALTFGMGVLVSMFTAVVVTRTFLLALGVEHKKPWIVFLFGSGIRK